MQFGQELRDHRERQGISLDDVAVSTRVSLKHLNALEEDRFKDLPGGVFNRGIVRSYAQACGLNGEETVQNFVAAMRSAGYEPEQKDDDWVEFAEAVRRSRVDNASSNRLRWLGVLGLVILVGVVAAGVLWVLVHRGIVHMPQKSRFLATHSAQ